MNDYIKIRRLALRYNGLSVIKKLIMSKLENKTVFKKLYIKRKELVIKRDLKRILNYILLYEAIFERSLKMLDCPFEKEIVEAVCKKGMSINKAALSLYISPSMAERALKKFLLFFINNLNASKRIISPLLKVKVG